MPPGEIASSVAWIMVASTVPSTTSRSASCTVPWTLMPRPTTNVRRSDGSRVVGRIGGRPGRPPGAGVGGGAGVVVNGCRDMVCTSCGWAGRKGGTPRPLSTGPAGRARDGRWAVPGQEATGQRAGGARFDVLLVVRLATFEHRLLVRLEDIRNRGGYGRRNTAGRGRNNRAPPVIHNDPQVMSARGRGRVSTWSSTCTIAAVPITGISRLSDGHVARQREDAPCTRTPVGRGDTSASAAVRDIRRMATAANRPRPIA